MTPETVSNTGRLADEEALKLVMVETGETPCFVRGGKTPKTGPASITADN
jgi:hypothetical protein